MLTIVAKGLYYKALNRQIRASLSGGAKRVVLKGVLGQRYIAGGLNGDAEFYIYGTPGQDLGAFMNGPSLIVYGNAQDGVGNTMNAGKIVIHGKAGEIPGHSMRGGKIYIGGDVEYRAAIHMKEYLQQIPWLVIGGTAKDYCGEYMAGGRVVVLNLGREETFTGWKQPWYRYSWRGYLYTR
jgi:glutamate synthase (NADPH) GltB3 subunit (EC 1.4.1.13)